MKNIILVATLAIGALAQAQASESVAGSTVFRWGRSVSGSTYCYEYTFDGRVLNEGNPVNIANCRRLAPTTFTWGRSQGGDTYCYEYTSTGMVLNEANPVHDYNCKKVAPTSYQWGRAVDGHTRCYEYAPNGSVLNKRMPVADLYCKDFYSQPTFIGWAVDYDGFASCVEFASNGTRASKPALPTEQCRAIAPTYYAWERGSDYRVNCYEFTAEKHAVRGRVLNEQCAGVALP